MTQQKQNGNIVAIIVMIFLFGMISFVTNLASPMGDILKFQFGVPNWMGTLGVFANFIAYAVMGYRCGYPNAFRSSGQFRHLSVGSIHCRFFHVFT